jgi:uncharacterized GH25 family protein
MKTSVALAALVLCLAITSAASAHFPWIVIDKSSGASVIRVWFSELAEPDSAELIDRIEKVQVWGRRDSGGKQDITLRKRLLDGGGGELTGPVPTGTPAASAYIKYGVLERRGERFLLEYHAKYLDVSAADWKSLARDEALALDIVTQAADKGFILSVLFQGKPAAAAEVIVLDPAAVETKSITNEAGRIDLAAARPGLYSIRAKWVVKEAGKVGDEEYPQVNHYCTLALRAP